MRPKEHPDRTTIVLLAPSVDTMDIELTTFVPKLTGRLAARE